MLKSARKYTLVVPELFNWFDFEVIGAESTLI